MSKPATKIIAEFRVYDDIDKDEKLTETQKQKLREWYERVFSTEVDCGTHGYSVPTIK